MIALPPSEPGAVQLTPAEAFPAVALPIVGAPGTVLGVTAFEAPESGEVPIAFVAATLKVYVVPFVKPLIVVDATFPTVVAV